MDNLDQASSPGAPAAASPPQTILFSSLSNQEFLERHAKPGCVGLSGGVTLVDRAVARAERRVDASGVRGEWSHAFIFQGRRADGHHWLVESDLQVHRKHVQLGVQENRISKYFDEGFYTKLAVLDFGLAPEQVAALLAEALDLVANRARYSVRELLGTLIALRDPRLRGRENLLARDRSMYCSAFVQHLYRKIGLDLAPGLDRKHTTPEDLARTGRPHLKYVLKREPVPGKMSRLRTRLRARVQKGITRLKEKRAQRRAP